MNINIYYWEYTYLPCWGYKYLLYWEYVDICLNKNTNIECPINLTYDKNLSSRAFMIKLNIKVIYKYEPTCICTAHTTLKKITYGCTGMQSVSTVAELSCLLWQSPGRYREEDEPMQVILFILENEPYHGKAFHMKILCR